MTSKFIFSIFLTLAFFGCQTTPKVDALDPGADASAEISNLQSKIATAESEQINVLAPTSFRNAKESLREAEKMRDKGKDNADTVKQIEKGYAWLKRANEIGQPRREEFKEILQTRTQALSAGAAQYARTELSRADDELESVTKRDSSLNISLSERQALQKNYVTTHTVAVKNHYLGQAREDLKKARAEGASNVVPKTLAAVEKKLQSAEVFADANYYKENEVADIAKVAQESAARLLVLTREAKINKDKTPEQLALDQEAANREIDASKKEISEKDQALSRESAEVAALKTLDQREASVRGLFSPDEAEVIRTNDGVIIRLSGLHFQSGQATLSPDDYRILSKAREAVKILGATTFVVEGHTDAVGNRNQNKKISEKRAESVKQYFEASGDLNNISIVSEGVGDQKPISSNKTRDGRAQNRRVDLILKDAPVAR